MFLGALRAYVIPILPFLFVLAAGIALIAALLEAMIALPLWCVKWMKMEGGEDFASEGTRMGMLLTVNIFLRPSLAILAYCGSYPVFDVVLRTMDSMWATTFLAQTGGADAGRVDAIRQRAGAGVVRSIQVAAPTRAGRPLALAEHQPQRLPGVVEGVEGAGHLMIGALDEGEAAAGFLRSPPDAAEVGERHRGDVLVEHA